MSRSVRFRIIRPALLVAASAFAWMPGAQAAPPSAPPLTIDTTYPNLFYGAIPSNTQPAPGGGLNGPVIVFVHGLGGSYVDWIEAKNCPAGVVGGCKASANAPGQGSNNDMYDWAYQAGYRTVFMSMNADNSGNSLSIQTNAAVLQTLFPTILSHFGVSKLFFVCHSKGGLDLEDAIANPKWIGIASAVLELGTPNQGDALANWIFSPSDTGLGQTLGLLTPGVESLEIANVLKLRTEWDPIFINAKIPFFTVSGNTYVCPGGPDTCPTGFSGPILTTITTPPGGKATPCGQTGTAPCNDGLVTHPESLLPTTYAMELGVLGVNHYLLRMGDYSFSFVNARVQALSNQQPGFNRVATGGFGDQNNNWSWSMAWFNNMLYVGTGREVACVTAATTAIQLGIPTEYPPSIGACTPDYHDLPLQAEIWQYNPATNVWTNVFESPIAPSSDPLNSGLSTVDKTGKAVQTARDIGFRGLTVVNEPNGVVALYAGGVTSGELFECHPPNLTTNCTPQGSWPPPRILRTTDGVHWAPIPQNGTLTTVSGSSVWTPGQCSGQPCFLGSLTAAGTYKNDQNPTAYPNYSLRSAAQLCSAPGPSLTCTQDGVLFFQVGDFPGVGRAFAVTPGINPALGDNCGTASCYAWASPPTATLPMWILSNFNNSMYAGTGSPAITGTGEQYGVWATNGSGAPNYTWNPIIIDGGYAQNLIADFAMSMQIYSDPTYCINSCLYVGTDRPNELVRIHPDTTGQVPVDISGVLDTNDSWDLIVGNPRTIPSGQPGAGQYVYPLSGIGQYFQNGFTGHFWRMGVGSQGLYLGTWDQSTDDYFQSPTTGTLWSQEYGTDLWRSPDGVNWTFVSKTGLGDGNNTGTRSSASTPYGLFMGTAREQGGTQVFNVDNGTLDLNKDGVIDMEDVELMRARLNSPVRRGDPMDLNEDGKITEQDVEMLMSQCTYPRCEVPAIKPASSGLTPPVAHSAPAGSIPAGTISITWTTVSGAADYLVYRITASPSNTTAPPGPPSAVAVACSRPGAPSVCAMLPRQASPANTALFGYPSAPEFLGRVTNPQYGENAPNTLQTLYFVVAEDSSGNLSSPSNVVGGPSLATQ
jgi:hypothetical protein